MSGRSTANWETGRIGGLEKRAIEIVPYSPDWALRFQSHAARIKAALGKVALRIEHIRSTSVEGLAAKPIVDILVVIADPSQEDRYLPVMLSAGYELRVREPDLDQHRMFRTPERDVHIHIFPPSSGEIERHLLFRDFLRANPSACEQYARLKRDLSRREWKDMNEYAQAKTKFIEETLRRART